MGKSSTRRKEGHDKVGVMKFRLEDGGQWVMRSASQDARTSHPLEVQPSQAQHYWQSVSTFQMWAEAQYPFLSLKVGRNGVLLSKLSS